MQKKILCILFAALLINGALYAQNTYVLNLQDENHYLQIDDNANNDLDLDSVFTIEAWIYIADATHGNERIFRSQGWQMYVVSGTGSGGADATVRVDGTFMSGSINLTVPTEEWHHVCLMSDGTNWTNNYIDGVAMENGGETDITGTINLRIGSYSTETTDFIGSIDEVRISNINRYSRWSFTVDKTDPPFTSDANTVLLYHFDDNTEFPPGNSSDMEFTYTNYGIDVDDYGDYGDLTFDTGSAIDERSDLARTFKLHANYPNPFNPTTNISFELPQSAQVSLKVFDLTGREVADLADSAYPAGKHIVKFNGAHLSSGVYIYSLQADQFTAHRKMMLVK